VNWQELVRSGLLDELAEVFGAEQPAQALLEDIGFPRGNLPAFDRPTDFWRQVCREIQSGILAGGFDELRAAAARLYPYNRVFNGRSSEAVAPAAPTHAETGTSLIISGAHQTHRLIDAARATASALGFPGRVEVGIANADNIQLRLTEATPEQAAQLADELRHQGLAARTTVVPNEFRDYLIGRIFVEGPDQSRYELADLPASTRLKDVARAVMQDSYGDTWPHDRAGQTRPAVIDRVDPETGGHERLDPHATLHSAGVRDEETLHMAPEATAGAVGPRTRDEALARVRSQVLAYAQEHPGFEVSANAKTAPTEYLFHFRAAGWGPPGAAGDEPFPVDSHEVLLLLPPDFPMKAPLAIWQTPFFHPNVHPVNGKVCLGVLEDRYRPGLDFGELCQMLVDIAGYQNYEIREGYDAQARAWAISREGQIAIESRGGRSISRLLFSLLDDHLREPLPMRIRRCDT
jgi:ubiquitin-protein ligase